MKVYTKTGDKGESSLLSGERVTKDHQRLQLYGEVDELNSFIGLLRSSIREQKDPSIGLLLEIQTQLFYLGALLASDKDSWEKFNLHPLNEKFTLDIEVEIDSIAERVPPLKNSSVNLMAL